MKYIQYDVGPERKRRVIDDDSFWPEQLKRTEWPLTEVEMTLRGQAEGGMTRSWFWNIKVEVPIRLWSRIIK